MTEAIKPELVDLNTTKLSLHSREPLGGIIQLFKIPGGIGIVHCDMNGNPYDFEQFDQKELAVLGELVKPE